MADYPKTPDDIAAYLYGSSLSLSSVLEDFAMEEAEQDTDFLEALDELVFCCTGCDWWFEQSEMAEDCGDDWVCEDCHG